MDNIRFIPENQKEVSGSHHEKNKELGYPQLILYVALILLVQIGLLEAVHHFGLQRKNTELKSQIAEFDVQIPTDLQAISRLGPLIGVTGDLSGQASNVGFVLENLKQEVTSSVRIRRITFTKRTGVIRIGVVASSVDDLIQQEQIFANLDFVQRAENSNIQLGDDSESITAQINIVLNQ